MHISVRPFLAIGLLCLSSCGTDIQSVRHARLPPGVAGSTVVISDVRPAGDDVAAQAYEVPDHSMFLRQSSGASLAVGILFFGPIAAAANGAMINQATQDMGKAGAVSNLYRIDAMHEARAVFASHPLKTLTASSPRQIALKPYINMYTPDDKSDIIIVANLRAEFNVELDGKAKDFNATYSYVVDTALPSAALKGPLPNADMEKLEGKIRSGYAELFTEIANDVEDNPPSPRQVAQLSTMAYLTEPMTLGFGEVDHNSQGHLVFRSTRSDNYWGYLVMVFDNDSQYKFLKGPQARTSRN